jgi:hypothetical protein
VAQVSERFFRRTVLQFLFFCRNFPPQQQQHKCEATLCAGVRGRKKSCEKFFPGSRKGEELVLRVIQKNAKKVLKIFRESCTTKKTLVAFFISLLGQS